MMRKSEFELLLLATVILFCGCKAVTEKKQPQIKFTPVEVSPASAAEKRKTPLANYAGKYSQKQLVACLQIPTLYEQTLVKVAKNLGLAYQGKITVKLYDWSPQDKDMRYRVETRIVEGKIRIQVCLITEQLVGRGYEFKVYFSRAIVEAIAKEKTASYPSPPTWFRNGAISYGLGQDKSVKRMMARLLEDPRGLADDIVGVGQTGAFPNMEGYFAFLYLKERYGESKVKELIRRVLWRGENWEQALADITDLNFPNFQNNAKLYTIDFIKNRYWPTIIAYRKALRLYLSKKYLEAIPAFNELSFQFPGSFMSGNLAFWLGMCYYRLNRYADAARYFQQCCKEYPLQCSHFPVARYRHAICLYRQTQINKAISELSDFVRDFPYHDLCASARFFLAECFAQRAQWLRAHNWYQKFLEKSPAHPRAGEARIKAGKICFDLGWYAQAKKHYQAAFDLPLPVKDFNSCRQAIAEIKAMEQGTPPAFLIARLEKLSLNFAQKDAARQQAIFWEMGQIGVFSLPWLKRLVGQCRQEVLKDLIEAISQSKDPGATTVFVEILKKYPRFSRETLVGLLKIGIPANFLQNIVAKTKDSMAFDDRRRVSDALEYVLWSSDVSLRERFPKLLENLNGNALQQLKILDRLALEFGQEQVPVLLRLAKDGATERVKRKALENLVTWKDSRSIPVLMQILVGKNEKFYALAIKGLAELKHFPADQLEKMLSGPLNARLAAVDALARGGQPTHWKIVLKTLENPSMPVRTLARKKLLAAPPQEILSLTIDAFLQQNHSVHFYMGTVEILEKITHKIVPYRPDMTFEQRKKLVDGLSMK